MNSQNRPTSQPFEETNSPSNDLQKNQGFVGGSWNAGSGAGRFLTIIKPEVQIDSFLGVQIHHLKNVMEKSDIRATAQTVPSVGLNNCVRNNLLETIKKQFQLLVALRLGVFPHAQVFFTSYSLLKQASIESPVIDRTD